MKTRETLSGPYRLLALTNRPKFPGHDSRQCREPEESEAKVSTEHSLESAYSNSEDEDNQCVVKYARKRRLAHGILYESANLFLVTARKPAGNKDSTKLCQILRRRTVERTSRLHWLRRILLTNTTNHSLEQISPKTFPMDLNKRILKSVFAFHVNVMQFLSVSCGYYNGNSFP